MNYESFPGASMPDLPQREHPEFQELKAYGEARVAAEIKRLDVGLDLEHYPDIRSRLAELGPHFEDSIEMAEIIRTVYGKLHKELNLTDEGPERLMRAAILHDIGKSGPDGDEGEVNYAVRRLFITPLRKFNPFTDGHAKTIREFIAEQDMSDTDRIVSGLVEAGIDPDQMPMIDFWRKHADWTYDILRHAAEQGLNGGLVNIAASHHLLEGKNPAGLDMAHVPSESHVLEIMETAELLTAVDKYQAFRVRSGLGHEATIATLKKIVDSHTELPELLRAKFHTIINALESSAEQLDALRR